MAVVFYDWLELGRRQIPDNKWASKRDSSPSLCNCVRHLHQPEYFVLLLLL
jgi:hypothetical protein